ncbi:MAG: hypothetical protein LBB83_01485 [Treponema sp.]|jgi:hypothetical protein|nr:hypothetical protein [Treponema sp.]
MKLPFKSGCIVKKPEELQQVFRRVFLSPDGLTVLRLLLNDWSYFEVCDTEQKRALNDYAKIFLHNYLGLANITVYAELDTSDFEKSGYKE